MRIVGGRRAASTARGSCRSRRSLARCALRADRNQRQRQCGRRTSFAVSSRIVRGSCSGRARCRRASGSFMRPELFDFANVEPLRSDEKPAEVPTRVTVTEGKHQKVNFGVGYGTEENGRVQVDWRHVNFLGGARTAGVLARYFGSRSRRPAEFQGAVFLRAAQRSDVTGQILAHRRARFTLDTNGGRVTRDAAVPARRRPGARLSAVEHALVDLRERIRELRDLERGARGSVVPRRPDRARARSHRRDGPRHAVGDRPRRRPQYDEQPARREPGYVLTAHLEQAGEWLGGTYDYYEVTTEARYLRQIGQVVAAVQGRLGSIDAFGNQDTLVPFFKLYFLGGATNLRGWGRFEVSPLSGAGFPIGGSSFFNFSAELRAPSGASSAGCSSSTAATSGPTHGFERQRSALRRGTRFAVPDANRPDPPISGSS